MRRAVELLALSQLLLLFTLPAFAQDAPSRRARQSKQVTVESNGTKIVVSNTSASRNNSAVLETWPIKGKSSTNRDEAWENALREADEKLVEYLRRFRPDTHWLQKDIRSFVDRMQNVKTQKLSPVEGLTEEEKREFDGKDLFAAELELNLTAPLKEELLRKLRHDEAKERQWWVTKGLLGVLALLATVGIYYRLDDRTKGYYTNLLRLGVLAALGTAGYGIAHLP